VLRSRHARTLLGKNEASIMVRGTESAAMPRVGPEGSNAAGNVTPVPEAAVQRESVPKARKPQIEPRPTIHDVDTSALFGEALDQSLNYLTSRFTLGLSPAALTEAYFDWLIHLAWAPGKRMQLTERAIRKMIRLARYAAMCMTRPEGGPPCIEPLPNDPRFVAEDWHR